MYHILNLKKWKKERTKKKKEGRKEKEERKKERRETLPLEKRSRESRDSCLHFCLYFGTMISPTERGASLNYIQMWNLSVYFVRIDFPPPLHATPPLGMKQSEQFLSSFSRTLSKVFLSRILNIYLYLL